MLYVTSGDIARKCDVDISSVNYALRRIKEEPIGIAGNARLFSKDTIGRVQQFLRDKRKVSYKSQT